MKKGLADTSPQSNGSFTDFRKEGKGRARHRKEYEAGHAAFTTTLLELEGLLLSYCPNTPLQLSLSQNDNLISWACPPLCSQWTT